MVKKSVKFFCNSNFSARGQFFSPDLIIAFGVFVFSTVLFFSASASVFGSVDLVNERKATDFVAHNALDSLVYSGGSPEDWEYSSFADVNSFGLADSMNILDEQKTVSLINYLNSENYFSAKQALGFGPYDLRLRLLSNGEVLSYGGVVLSGGRFASNAKTKAVYDRIVSFGGSVAVLEAVVSISK